MRLKLETRLKRLEALLPHAEPKDRLLIKTVCELAGGEVHSTTISEGPMGTKGPPLFYYRPGDPAEAEAEAYIAAGRFKIMELRIIETRDPDQHPFLPVIDTAPAPEAPGCPVEARSDGNEATGQGKSGGEPIRDNAQDASTGQTETVEGQNDPAMLKEDRDAI